MLFMLFVQVKELNSYVALKKHCHILVVPRCHTQCHIFYCYIKANLENNKRVDLFDGPSEGFGEDNGLLASSMTNQQLMDNGNQMMDETDQAIERSKKVSL
ncbi:hypothetical protein EZV62_003114 [Acer yangbiense]|uniref:Uncharacterized protein n=1 Tax=Acer yangbiense TaxID=1000413 RepID=A0A5C7IGN9_9ROSI|nr:hypothetical protein EZV62_003114 [Acer yangbiense]